MDRTIKTELELQVLAIKLGDVQRQLMLLTDAYTGASLNLAELETLRVVSTTIELLELWCRELRIRWKERVSSGQESNRSDTGGADAAGPAWTGDDVPPSTTG